MKKSFIVGFLCGAIIFGTVSAIAITNYEATPNIFPIIIDGEPVNIDGYNINGYTYFKLRDIGQYTGFDVGFENDTIIIGNNKKNDGGDFKIRQVDTNGKRLQFGTVEIEGHLYYDQYDVNNAILKNTSLYYDDGIFKFQVLNTNEILLENIDYIKAYGGCYFKDDLILDTLIPLDQKYGE